MKNFTIKQFITASILVVVIGMSPLFAQQEPPSTAGKDFWLTFGMANLAVPGDPFFMVNSSMQLKVTALEDATVTLSFTDNPSRNASFFVPAGTVYTYDFVEQGRRDTLVYPPNSLITRTKKSVHITSTGVISVYALNHAARETDVSCLFPSSNLGMEYYNVSRVAEPFSSDCFLAIATENGTQIQVTSTLGVVTTYSNLLKGELIIVYAHNYITNDPKDRDMTGWKITSNNPIALFSAHCGTYIPAGTDWRNNLFQQLPPVWEWGLRFFVPVTSSGKDRLRIVASQNGTTVSYTGLTPQTIVAGVTMPNTLNAGQWTEMEVNSSGAGYIITNKPVGVCAYMPSKSYGVAGYKGAPAMCWIPPIEQTIKWGMIAPFVPGEAYVPSGLADYSAILIVKSAYKNATYYAQGTDNPVLLSNFSPAPVWKDYPSYGDGYSYCTVLLNVHQSSYYFGNENGLLVLGYATGESPTAQYTESYYYSAGMAVRNLYPSFYVNDIHYQDLDGSVFCGVGSFKFELQSVTGHASGTWLTWEIRNSANQVVHIENNTNPWTTALPQGFYTVSMTYRSDILDIPPYTLVTHFTVKDYTAVASDIMARDTTICSGSVNLSTLVSAVPGIANPQFRWYYSEAGMLQLTTLTVSPTVTTEYWVSVEGANHCEGAPNATGRKKVTVNRGLGNSTPNLITMSNVTVCGAQNITLTGSCSSQVANPVYYWYTTPNTASLVHIGPTYTFSAPLGVTSIYVAVMGSNYCDGGTSARKQVTVTALPYSNSSMITITSTSPICANEEVIITADAPDVVNPVFRWYDSETATIPFFTGNPYITSDITEETRFYVRVSGDNYCAK
jgi:hypothetical protein